MSDEQTRDATRRHDQIRALLVLDHDILHDDPACQRVLRSTAILDNRWDDMTAGLRADVISALVSQDMLAFAAGRRSV